MKRKTTMKRREVTKKKTERDVGARRVDPTESFK